MMCVAFSTGCVGFGAVGSVGAGLSSSLVTDVVGLEEVEEVPGTSCADSRQFKRSLVNVGVRVRSE
jgi:hypothetical protein